MTGLLLLFVVGIWSFIAIKLTKFIIGKLSKTLWRPLVAIFLFAIIFPLPLLDEIIGGWKFEQLCKENSEITLDTLNTKGKTVWFGGSQRTQINLGTMHIIQSKRNYVNSRTQEPIYHYFRFEANGGWLISALGISEGNSPLIFSAVCQPSRKEIETINVRLGLTQINRPAR